MSDTYVIELQGKAVGIILRKHKNEPAYRFLATLRGFDSLDGQEFAGPLQAECAARRLWREQPQALPPRFQRNARA